MANHCYLSILLGTLLMCSLLLSAWTAQYSGTASRSRTSSTTTSRLAMRRLGTYLDSEWTTEFGSLPDGVTINVATPCRALVAENLIQDSGSATIGVVRNHDREIIKTSSNPPQVQPQQFCEYTVVIETGKQNGAGTDSDISLRLSNKDGHGSQVYLRHLSNGHRTFEKGHVDTFVIRNTPCVADICTMVLYTDDYGFFSEWFVVSLKLSVATTESSGLLGPVVQEKSWEINEWLPKEDNKEELFTIYDDCNVTQ